MYRLLLIEDDAVTAREVVAFLGDRGFDVSLEVTGTRGFQKAMEGNVDLLIVDRMLPGVDGLSLLAALRRVHVTVPAIVLSAMNDLNDRVHGLEIGGDDYLGKPFALVELEARVQALLRRQAHVPGSVLRVGSLELDLVKRRARRGDRELDLLPREFQILEYLMRHEGQTVTRGMLFASIWNYNFELSPNLVDVHVGKLRRKLNGPGETELLFSVKKVGFVMQDRSAK